MLLKPRNVYFPLWTRVLVSRVEAEWQIDIKTSLGQQRAFYEDLLCGTKRAVEPWPYSFALDSDEDFPLLSDR